MKNIFDVVTFGEAMIMFIAGEEKPLDDVSYFSKGVAGAELNVATGIARLGFNVSWISKIGKDSFGRTILNYLNKENINSDFVKIDSTHRTGFQLKSKLKNMNGDPEVEYFRRGSAASYLSIADLDKVINTKFLHITGIALALSDNCFDVAEYLINQVRSKSGIITFDPNLRPVLWKNEDIMREKINYLASKSDIVLPGVNEGKILTGYDSNEDIANFYIKNGAKKVIIKLGKKGAYFRDSIGNEGTVPAVKVDNIIDTVGAGDAFAVGVISALLENKTLEQAAKRGNFFGALAIQFPGDNDGLPNKEQLSKYDI
ncbi:sugar kinase [Gallibacterium genomosp. 1]|uniref:2-dehydro-3-deoxygluconokinase n=1 Tax=Gallibacterium genomosp. 1 TaxID=155515 RepID=A0AB36DY26_9PAST|nr:sugar kinase [Gallibacterium genomosp. 1]OBX02489.1 2-dehydro-3-deoxygluconokinase [Gallibacterium genomosp. 1]OBX03666.1 2-dehydro-3-deoxygluconokinase [Gallibacterium genomosp. 1]